MKSKSVIDSDGNEIKPGNKVIYLYIENSLLEDLPFSEQNAIKAQKDKEHEVTTIDDNGFVEIEFEYMHPDSEVTFHSIWVNPNCLRRS